MIVTNPHPELPDTWAGPTEADETDVLESLYGQADDEGVYRVARYEPGFTVADVLSPRGVEGMLAEARKSLGLREPNHIQEWYQERNGSAFNYNFPWCQASVTFWSYRSGNYQEVCPRGDRAYTVYGAQDGEHLGKWYSGTAANLRKYAKRGAIVFFDWDGSNTIGRIDHVGICESNLGDGRLQTIEGNTADVCARRVRAPGVIAGFWNPAYQGAAPSAPPKPYVWDGKAPSGSPVLQQGSTGDRVRNLQSALNKVRGAKLTVDGDYGPATESAVEAMQRAAKLEADGEYGPLSAAALAKALAGETPVPTPKPPAKPKVTVPSGTPMLKLDSTGTRVRQLQEALNAVHNAGLKVDGEYGPKTEAAVEKFQRASKLDDDGVYGPKSAAALKKAVS